MKDIDDLVKMAKEGMICAAKVEEESKYLNERLNDVIFLFKNWHEIFVIFSRMKINSEETKKIEELKEALNKKIKEYEELKHKRFLEISKLENYQTQFEELVANLRHEQKEN